MTVGVLLWAEGMCLRECWLAIVAVLYGVWDYLPFLSCSLKVTTLLDTAVACLAWLLACRALIAFLACLSWIGCLGCLAFVVVWVVQLQGHAPGGLEQSEGAPIQERPHQAWLGRRRLG